MITVKNITRTRNETGGARLSAQIECDDSALDNQRVWYEYPKEYSPYLSASGDPWITAFIAKAMLTGQYLKIEAPVSKQLINNIDTFQDIYINWSSKYKKVKIDVPGTFEKVIQGKNTVSFLSGGVDSFYTVLKNLNSDLPSVEKISHSILIHGFDIPLSNHSLFNVTFNNVKQAAEKLGLKLITCKSNVKELLCPEWSGWGLSHGQLLISTVMGIEGAFKCLYVPASFCYRSLFPWGSHILTDPLFSTESLRIIHDGAEATRAEKIFRQIAKSAVALEHLRVCYENRFGLYNCGACKKCIRTMTSLRIAGVLDECETFERELSYSDIANMHTSTRVERAFTLENLELAKNYHADPKLIRAIKASLRPWAQFRPHRILRYFIMRILRPLDNVILGGRLREFYKKNRLYQHFH